MYSNIIMMQCCIITGDPPPQPPTSVTSDEISSTSVSLKWGAPNDFGPNELTGYRVTYVTSDGRLIELNFNNTIFSTNITDLRPDFAYTFAISALNEYGPSPQANITITLSGTNVESETLLLPYRTSKLMSLRVYIFFFFCFPFFLYRTIL